MKGNDATKNMDAKMLQNIILVGRRKLNGNGAIVSIAALLLATILCMPALIAYNNDHIGIDIRGKITTNNIDRLRVTTPSGRSLKSKIVPRALEDDNFDIPDALPDGGAMAMSTLVRQPIAPYSLANVLATVPQFHDTFAVVVYDPPTDKFIAHYSNNMRWISSCHKLVTSFKIVAHSLRMLNPERFAGPTSPEFALALSSADYPGIKWDECLRQQRTDCIYGGGGVELSPILQFGSSFRQPLFPTMVTMPMPQKNHLSCFHYFALHGIICDYYLQRSPSNPQGLVFPENIEGVTSWDDLIPQVVWRGTDFSYLHKLFPRLRPPDFDMDVASQIDLSDKVDKPTAATYAMRQVYDELIPRWKGVVLTAEAEREAEQLGKEQRRRARAQRRRHPDEEHRETQEQPVPWANIKFAGAMYMGKKTATPLIQYYQQFTEYGIPASGEGMSLEDLGRYRYHIDLGGGGGTTWSGTLEKLGLPGLLFHHVTPTGDYLHEKLVPWVHYVPVKADLSDLREKFDWAESHPEMARQISDNATELARSWGTPEGFEAMFRDFFESPLRQIMEAYQPLEQGSDWRKEIALMGGEELRPVLQCGGYHQHDCDRLADDIDFRSVHDRDVGMST